MSSATVLANPRSRHQIDTNESEGSRRQAGASSYWPDGVNACPIMQGSS